MVMTRGNPNSAVGVKWYYSPVRNKLIGRIPGVNRTSAAVLARNARVASAKPASGCAGLGYKGFIKCLSEAMKRI